MSSDCQFDDQILTREFMANPYALYHRMRADAPVYWSKRFNAWMLTRYSDVRRSLQDPRLNSHERIGAILSQLPESARTEMRPLSSHLTKWVAFTDPPDHTRLRALVDKAFTPRMIADLRDPIQSIVDELLDRVQEAGRMDVVADFSFPLPATVISSMLGIPRADHGRFRKWSSDIANFISAGGINIEVTRQAQKSVTELGDYFQGIVKDRRQTPREDLISLLVAAEEQGQKLTEEELFAMFVQLFFAGHETTTGLINNGLLALLLNPKEKHSGAVVLNRPDKVRVTRRGGFADIEAVFDGKMLTLIAKTANVYGEVNEPGSIDHLIDTLRDKHERPVPGADLLISNLYDELMASATEVRDVGSGVIGGVECDHLAVRKDEVDWQIWIAQGDRPYPCRYVITSKLVADAPQYSIQTRDWKTGNDVAADDFSFKNSANAKKITLKDLDTDELPENFRPRGSK